MITFVKMGKGISAFKEKSLGGPIDAPVIDQYNIALFSHFLSARFAGFAKMQKDIRTNRHAGAQT